MSTDDRLAVIETEQASTKQLVLGVKEALAEIRGILQERQRDDRRQIETNAAIKGDIKLLRVGVGISLLASVGGVGAFISKLLGV